MQKPLEIALTLDVEFNKPSIIEATGSLYSGLAALPPVLEVFETHGVPGTWLIAHDVDPENQVARLFPGLVERMALQGEIGSHFHFHEQRRVRTDEAFQRAGIGQATGYLRSLGHAVTTFRGGNSYLDPTTLAILGELGYTVDSSVVPGLKEVSPEGLVTDHKSRRGCDPYWHSGGAGLLEIPLATHTLLDLRTPLLSLLINRVVGINNFVLADPDSAFERIESIVQATEATTATLALSAHPYDFLEDPRAPRRKIENLVRFISLLKNRPGTIFTTLGSIRSRWASEKSAAPAVTSMLQVTSADLRRVRNTVRRAVGAGRTLLAGHRP